MLAYVLFFVTIAVSSANTNDLSNQCITAARSVSTEVCSRFTECCLDLCNSHGQGTIMGCSFNTATQFDMKKTFCRCRPFVNSFPEKKVEMEKSEPGQKMETASTSVYAAVEQPYSQGANRKLSKSELLMRMIGMIFLNVLLTLCVCIA